MLLNASAVLTMAVLSSCSGSATGGNSSYQIPFLNSGGNLSTGAAAVNSKCAGITTGVNGGLNGFVPFPANNPWNTSVQGIAADSNSATLIANYEGAIGTTPNLQGDFGPVYGELYNVVDSSTQPVQPININQYPEQSDVMPVPLPNTAVVEGGSQTCTGGGDCHMFILDRNQCWLYETWDTSFNGTQWQAANMAVWDMLNTSDRPYGWTSADAAGLPVFPGLLRYDEAASGVINHAIRFTFSKTVGSFIAPASHAAGSTSAAFTMGTRLRLKSSVDISSFSSMDQAVLTAMKNYGIILADNGLDLEIAGVNDTRWAESDVVALKTLNLDDFEVVSQGASIAMNALPSGQAPVINSFAASSQSITSGSSVTLNWSTSDSSWNFIDVLGPVRGNSVTISPTATTTYVFTSTNTYGRSTQAITVIVN